MDSLFKRTPEHVVWSLAKPIPLHVDRQYLYGHAEGVEYVFATRSWRFAKGSRLYTDRLLNVFPLKKWAGLTSRPGLRLRIRYRGGQGDVSVMTCDGKSFSLLRSIHLPASRSARTLRVDLSTLPSYSEYLYLKVQAYSDMELIDASIVTEVEPSRPVRLGIAITTFKRPLDIERQVELLEDLAGTQLSYKVFVIDNASDLKLPRAYRNTEVIASANLGGAGGFTRGLLAVMDEGGFTHAMFMDDDAFCHPETLARAAALIRYSKHSDLALTGAMNYLHAPEIQYELGGRIADYGVGSIRMNADTNNLAALCDNDREKPPNYGAWWCFIFPLASVRTLPFPFFVRGDDITFSMQNRFKLETWPGLVAWQPSFEYKIGASTEYLVHRSFLTMPLLPGAFPWKKAAVVHGLRHAFAMEIDGLRYPIAEAICAALEDVMTGPSFWLNVANTTARMQQLARTEAAFTARSHLPGWTFRPEGATDSRNMQRLIARLGKLNLPIRLAFRGPVLSNQMYPKQGQAAFRKGVIYYPPDGGRSLSCARDWRWRSRVEARFEQLVAEYEAGFETLAERYAEQQEALQSENAWRERLGLAPSAETPSPATPASASRPDGRSSTLAHPSL